MTTFVSIVGGRLAAIADAIVPRSIFQQQQHQVFFAGGGSLQQRSVSAMLRGVYVCSGFEQCADDVQRVVQRNAGVQRLVPQRIMGALMYMGPMLQQ